jgi:hypothetical protein
MIDDSTLTTFLIILDKLIATNIDWYDFVVVETIDFTEEVIAVPSIPDSIPVSFIYLFSTHLARSTKWMRKWKSIWM